MDFMETKILEYLKKYIIPFDSQTKILSWHEDCNHPYIHVHYKDSHIKLWKLIHIDDLLLNFDDHESLQDRLIEEYETGN